MQILFYIFILCAIASSAQEMHLFDMIESHGALLKIVEVVPHAVWCVAETGIMIAVFIMTKKRISHIASRYNSLWIALLVLCGVAGIFDIMDYGKEESFITLSGTLIVLAMIVVMSVLGYKIARNYDGKIRTIGNVFTFAPGICLIIGLLIMAMLPDSFGEMDTRTYDYGGAYIRYEQSYNTSTIVLTVVMALVSALMEIIPVGACTEYIRTTGESDDDPGSEDESDNISETGATQGLVIGTEIVAAKSPDIPEEKVCNLDDVTEEEPSKSRKKKFAIIFSIVLAVIAGVAIWAYTKSDDHVGNNYIAAEAIYENGRKIIFTSDHKVKFMDEGENEEDVCASPDGSSWWMDGDVLVCFTGEGTSHFSIIDGYEYQGEYRSEDGMCYNEEWVGDQETGGLDDVGYYPTSSKGTKLKSFKWVKSKSKSKYSTEDISSCYDTSDDLGKETWMEIVHSVGLSKITLGTQAGNRYDAENLFDGDDKTAWVIGGKEFNEYEIETEGHFPRMIYLRPKDRCRIIAIKLLNGYQKSISSWENNARVRTITIMGCSDDSKFAQVLFSGNVADSRDWQYVRFTKTGIYDYYSLIIEDIYHGIKYDDVGISEMKFFSE